MKKKLSIAVLLLLSVSMFASEMVYYDIENNELKNQYSLVTSGFLFTNNPYLYNADNGKAPGLAIPLAYEFYNTFNNKLLLNLAYETNIFELFKKDEASSFSLLANNFIEADLGYVFSTKTNEVSRKVVYTISDYNRTYNSESYIEHYILVDVPTEVSYGVTFSGDLSLYKSNFYNYGNGYLGLGAALYRTSNVDTDIVFASYPTKTISEYVKDSLSGNVNLFLDGFNYRNFRLEYTRSKVNSTFDGKYGLAFESPVNFLAADPRFEDGKAPFVFEAYFCYGFGF